MKMSELVMLIEYKQIKILLAVLSVILIFVSYAFYKSADNKEIYCKVTSTNNGITSTYYECFALKEEH